MAHAQEINQTGGRLASSVVGARSRGCGGELGGDQVRSGKWRGIGGGGREKNGMGRGEGARLLNGDGNARNYFVFFLFGSGRRWSPSSCVRNL
jgi:hypothetical protein